MILLIVAIFYYRSRTRARGGGSSRKVDMMRHQNAKPPSDQTGATGAIEVRVGDKGAGAVAAPKRETGVQQRQLEVGGAILHYVEALAESPRGRIVLVHGFGGDKRDWSGLLRPLMDAGFDACALDLPGFGESTPSDEQDWSVTGLLKLLRLFNRESKTDRLHLIGASLGATLAACYAYAVPKEVMSLVLIEPLGLRVPYETELDKALERGQNPMVVTDEASFQYQLAFLHATPPEMPEAVRAARAEAAMAGHDHQLAAWRALRDGDRPHILDAVLPEIQTRTLIVQGASSRVVHTATGNVARDTMRAARVVTIPDTGHRPMVEQPAAVTEAVLGFLRGVTGS
ncbi:MAG: alpha/beta hydrolase [Acidobacteriota bacterium]